MKKFGLRLSLRYKLLLLLTALPVLSLALYLAMATSLFQRDKLAYVFDSSATVSRSLATQVKTELLSQYTNLRNVAEDFDVKSHNFSLAGKKIFDRNAQLKVVLLFKRMDNGSWSELGRLHKPDGAAALFLDDVAFIEKLKVTADQFGAHVMESSKAGGNAGIAFRLGDLNESNRQIVIGFFQADDLVTAFGNESFYKSYLVTRQAEVAVGGSDQDAAQIINNLRTNLSGQAPEGTAEVSTSNGRVVLASYASVQVGNLSVASYVDKSQALKAVEVLIAKSLLFFIALIAGTLLISIFASKQLTSALLELFEATRKIANGNFDIHIKPKTRDEVGGLAESFNTMAAEVSRLLSETAENARLQNELNTVRTVQETLFPTSSTQFGPISIVGHFEPASECGGDWWHYSKIGNKIYIWIGDATGHGAPAALITSAACSAAAVISSIPDITPSRAISILNDAIYKTSKGQIMMTFFIACFDLDKNKLIFANASHEPPYLMRTGSDEITKKDLRVLMDVNGPRLGDVPNFQYDQAEIDFQAGDKLFFYTDGLLDIQDASGKKWSDRLFLKAMMKCANMQATTDDKAQVMVTEIDGYRKGTELIDDVTFVMCEVDKGAA